MRKAEGLSLIHIFTSGQLPIDPATGAFPEGIEAQTRQSLELSLIHIYHPVPWHGGSRRGVLPRHPVYPQKQTQSGIRPYLFFTTGDARFRASLSAPQIRKAPPCCAQDFAKSAQFMTARTGFPQNFTALLRFMTGRFAWTVRQRYAEKREQISKILRMIY